MSGAGASSGAADGGWISQELAAEIKGEWTMCRSLPCHVLARSLMAFSSVAERASFSALRLESAGSLAQG